MVERTDAAGSGALKEAAAGRRAVRSPRLDPASPTARSVLAEIIKRLLIASLTLTTPSGTTKKANLIPGSRGFYNSRRTKFS